MKKIIIIDENDNEVGWEKALWKAAWKNVFIPKNLRGKIKIVFDKKDGHPIIKKKHERIKTSQKNRK
jgi:hypothetical protein